METNKTRDLSKEILQFCDFILDGPQIYQDAAYIKAKVESQNFDWETDRGEIIDILVFLDQCVILGRELYEKAEEAGL